MHDTSTVCLYKRRSFMGTSTMTQHNKDLLIRNTGKACYQPEVCSTAEPGTNPKQGYAKLFLHQCYSYTSAQEAAVSIMPARAIACRYTKKTEDPGLHSKMHALAWYAALPELSLLTPYDLAAGCSQLFSGWPKDISASSSALLSAWLPGCDSLGCRDVALLTWLPLQAANDSSASAEELFTNSAQGNTQHELVVAHCSSRLAIPCQEAAHLSHDRYA